MAEVADARGLAARYRALFANTRDLSRRRMLEEMITRELDAAANLDLTPLPPKELPNLNGKYLREHAIVRHMRDFS